MTKLILIAALAFTTSAFARGDKQTFRVSVSGPTAQAAINSASDLVATIEAAGDTRADYLSLGLPALYADECSLTNSEIKDGTTSDYLDRDAHITGQVTFGVNPRTGAESWTARVLVSCEK